MWSGFAGVRWVFRGIKPLTEGKFVMSLYLKILMPTAGAIGFTVNPTQNEQTIRRHAELFIGANYILMIPEQISRRSRIKQYSDC